MSLDILDFEKPIAELDEKIAAIRAEGEKAKPKALKDLERLEAEREKN